MGCQLSFFIFVKSKEKTGRRWGEKEAPISMLGRAMLSLLSRGLGACQLSIFINVKIEEKTRRR